MPRVLVIGDVMTDIIVKPEGPVAHGADRRATVRALPGGAGANQACWLASEGVETRFAGRVGHEDLARQKLLLAAYRVDARLAADPALPTGSLVTLLSYDGERSFLTDRAANLNLDRADLPDALLDGVDLVHVSGYSLFEKGPRAAVVAFMAMVRERGVPFSIDPASHSFLREAGAANFMKWTRGANFLFPNEDEATVLAGIAEPATQLERLLEHYPIVALKRGAAGAIAGDVSGNRWSSPAPSVNVLDTSGAGDAFFGGFLGSYLTGASIEAALARAVALGSSAVSALGARPPLPSHQA